MLSKLIVATIAGFVAVPAVAADIQVPVKAPPPVAESVFTWTGLYVGLNSGYAFGRSNAVSSFTCPTFCAHRFPDELAAYSALGTGTMNSNGFTGGGQIGLNWQSGRVVFGAEADFNALSLSLKRSATRPNWIPETTETTSLKTDWLLTLRGRLGMTITPTLLAYATGGLALSRLDVTNSYFENTTALNVNFIILGSSQHAEIKAGWTAGGGLEWAYNSNWSVKAEYLYVDLGSVGTTASVAVSPPTTVVNPNQLATSADLRAHIARVGINYRFGASQY